MSSSFEFTNHVVLFFLKRKEWNFKCLPNLINVFLLHYCKALQSRNNFSTFLRIGLCQHFGLNVFSDFVIRFANDLSNREVLQHCQCAKKVFRQNWSRWLSSWWNKAIQLWWKQISIVVFFYDHSKTKLSGYSRFSISCC